MLCSLASCLPTEILDHICCDISSPSDLFPLLLTNSVVHPIAARVLYRDLANLSKIQTVHLLQSLSKPPNPSNDKYIPSRHGFVKNLEINFDDSTLLMSLLTMIRQTLEHLPNLKSLLIEFSSSDNRRPLARFFPLNAPFKLRYLTTSVRYDPELAMFLNTQPEIQDLSLRGFQTTGQFKLNPDALPNLRSFRSVHTGPSVISQMITGRPIEAMSLSLYPDDSPDLLDTLNLPSTNIKRLTLLMIDCASPYNLFQQLSSRLPDLIALHIVALGVDYNMVDLFDCATTLSTFNNLQYLTYMVSGPPATIAQEALLAVKWAAACPTLRTIILPRGKVWYQKGGVWTSGSPLPELVPAAPSADYPDEAPGAGQDAPGTGEGTVQAPSGGSGEAGGSAGAPVLESAGASSPTVAEPIPITEGPDLGGPVTTHGFRTVCCTDCCGLRKA